MGILISLASEGIGISRTIVVKEVDSAPTTYNMFEVGLYVNDMKLSIVVLG